MKKLKKIFFVFLLLGVLLVLLYPKKIVVVSLILCGKIIAPEASEVLSHYCFGNGDTLYLDPEYIKNSPVVLRKIKTLKEGETIRVTFKQSEDWRLSYALNPFQLTNTPNTYLIHQYINFESTGDVFTELNLGFTKISVKDNIVHAFECKPFIAICEIKK